MYPHTFYLICSIERTGSSLLADDLARTRVAGHPREYFHPGFLQDLALRSKSSAYMKYFREIIQAGTTANGVWGGKMPWSHMESLMAGLRKAPEHQGVNAPSIMESIFPNLRYIWLTRRDKVRQAVSLLKARQTNIWRKIAGQTIVNDTVPTAIPTFDVAALDSLVQEIIAHETAWQHYFAVCGVQPYVLKYEDLLRAHDEIIHQVLRYLDIDVPTNLKIFAPRFNKQSDLLSEEWVSNYHTLCNRGKVQNDL